MQALSCVINTLPRALDGDLRREQELPLTEYFALASLVDAKDRRVRMSELAARLSITISGATRTVNRLESLGLVERERSSSDGRGADVVLTESGYERLREAWPSHLASARRRVLDHLSEDEVRILTRALGAISAASGDGAD